MSAPTSPLAATSNPPNELTRSLTYRDLVGYGLAYIAPVAPLSTFGFVWDASGGLIALAYLLGAICMYFTAKSYAVMSEIIPNSGSVYGFARHALGPLPGFVAGWLILLDYLLIPALIFLLMSVGMQTIIPGIDRATWVVILVLSTVAINWFGVTVTSRVSLASALAQFAIIGGLLTLVLVTLAHGKGNGAVTLRPLFDPTLFDPKKIFTATSICVLSFLGFDAISTLSEEVQDSSHKFVGRAIMSVLGLCAAVFVITAIVLGNLMPGVSIKDPADATFELLATQIGPWSAVALAWLLAVVVGFTNALPMQAGVARVLFAMGRDRQLPACFSRLHPKFRTPHIAMIVSALFSLVVALVMRNNIDTLASFVNFGALSGFLLLHVSVIVHLGIRGRSRNVIVHWAIPVAGIVIVLTVLSGMAPAALKIGAGWLAIGLIYGVVLKARGRAELHM